MALGMSEADARRYTNELKGGRTVVVVEAGDRSEEALEILHHHGGAESQ